MDAHVRLNIKRELRAGGVTAAPLIVLQVLSLAGTAASPALFDSPLLLVGLSPRLPFLAVAARDTSLVPFLLVATARLCLADPIHFALGRRVGASAPTLLGRKRVGALLRRAQALGQGRHGRLAVAGLVFVRPISRHLTLAGTTALRGRTVAAIDVVATLLYLAAIRICGDALW